MYKNVACIYFRKHQQTRLVIWPYHICIIYKNHNSINGMFNTLKIVTVFRLADRTKCVLNFITFAHPKQNYHIHSTSEGGNTPIPT